MMRFKHVMIGLALCTASVPPALEAAAAGEKHEQGQKTVALDSIPAPARQTILNEAKGAPVMKVEEEQKDGKTVYEAHVKQNDGMMMGIMVGADGKLIGKKEKKERHGEQGKPTK